MEIQIRAVTQKDRSTVAGLLSELWGSEIIVSRGKVYHAANLPGFLAWVDGQIKGMITYHIENDQCEIVTLDSMLENFGIGSALVDSVVQKARTAGCRRVWLITTNDNIHAIRFYQRRGFDMAALHRNAIEESRKIKPQIPLKGLDDIPIRHEIEFELCL
ncbi:MAG TPA: GNAT family N-acetyltransferase [Thermoclostridium caenicola]|uniref:N-acetylglutamate synthase, GNAT family n=1 Tax=Thermoclostridium caenicola TaxID=659425 RepID=A0A1M6AI19_9FIRM|nr:GNAT family N-acetyltransferase [Thermoclostridium caenicola]SHI36164.1 N-acetylglutamate synthase, GNAT family [Thermoclostridium caenicola]HOK43965.1 GNAT family N-acetyltransferase [Thermoclostridium caenicola]HOL85474.1 GNAT family N-acetyltransferase [Thermoclostridium caenicola]HOP72330.1 GNAT family N-acetyltransferase [Thermoclostridium caenicola]HPO77640.1 GNAT family N-acetyltransferase [Thermoclostridium caenicola]